MTIVIQTGPRPAGRTAVSILISTQPPDADAIETFASEPAAIGAALAEVARRTDALDELRECLFFCRPKG